VPRDRDFTTDLASRLGALVKLLVIVGEQKWG
jgi:hypothetical protein